MEVWLKGDSEDGKKKGRGGGSGNEGTIREVPH